MSRPTIVDVARAAGVSVSTVDRVINGRLPVRPATAERVLGAAETVGFYATGLMRQRLRADVPERTLGFLLQQRSIPFYRLLGEALVTATAAAPEIRGRAVIDFMDDLTPGAVADRLERMAGKADAVAVVAADHPHVTASIARLAGRGVPTVALISDLTAESRAGYVGVDNRKLGRTAAWLIANMARLETGRGGPIAIMVGSHRYLCQEACEIGFRAFLREQAPEFTLLDPVATLESAHYAYELTLDLLKREPDLAGLHVAGGGIEGVMRALVDAGAAGRVVVVARDLTEDTRAGLIDGTLKAVLSHPLDQVAARAVDLMTRPLGGAGESPWFAHGIVPFDIVTPENL